MCFLLLVLWGGGGGGGGFSWGGNLQIHKSYPWQPYGTTPSASQGNHHVWRKQAVTGSVQNLFVGHGWTGGDASVGA